LAQELALSSQANKEKDHKIKQLKYENQKILKEIKNSHHNSSTSTSVAGEFDNPTQNQLILEQECTRKQIKRLTGELDLIETYLDSLYTLLKERMPLGSQSDLSKVMNHFDKSIAYMKDLFDQNHLNVQHGKRMQRKIRYEQLKQEFTQLITSTC
jgi:hypothetical protein